MLARTTLAVVAALITALPVSSQEHTWTPDRPDAYASAGITRDRTLEDGRIQLFYRFHNARLDGNLVGREPIDTQDLLRVYEVVPILRTTRTHEVGVLFAPVAGITLHASGSFVDHSMDEITATPDLFRTEASGIGDVTVAAMADVFRQGPYRAHLSAGVNIPTGSITERAEGAAGTFQLPYVLQTGSGTWDLLPGATLQVQNESGSVGIQGEGTIRLGENSRRYRLGHALQVSGWAALALNDYLSVASGVVYEFQGAIRGEDPELDFSFSPAEDNLASGGTFVDVPVGLNLFVRDGLLAGQRFMLEGRWPVVQNPEGPQLKRRMRLSARWQTTVSLF